VGTVTHNKLQNMWKGSNTTRILSCHQQCSTLKSTKLDRSQKKLPEYFSVKCTANISNTNKFQNINFSTTTKVFIIQGATFFLFLVDRCKFPELSVMVSQLFSPYSHLWPAGLGFSTGNRYLLDNRVTRYNYNKCRMFSYKIYAI